MDKNPEEDMSGNLISFFLIHTPKYNFHQSFATGLLRQVYLLSRPQPSSLTNVP